MTKLQPGRTAILALALAMGASGQSALTNRLDIGQKIKQNAEALKHYTYKRRTEVIVKGEPRGARVDLVRYINGDKETIPLQTPERTEPSTAGRGLRGKFVQRKVEKKKEAIKAQMERLKDAMNQYLSPDSMRTILSNAKIIETGSGPDADIKLSVAGMKSPTDSFTMVWSKAKHQPVSIDIETEADRKPVRITTYYSALPDDTFYPAKTVISAPDRNVGLTITSYDYVYSTEQATLSVTTREKHR